LLAAAESSDIPRKPKPFDIRAHDDSREPLVMPETVDWNTLRDHIVALPGVKVSGYLTDHVTEDWMELCFRGHEFTVNH